MKNDLFSNSLINEYINNLQNNQKISVGEFVLTKKILIMIALLVFLSIKYSESPDGLRYVYIGFGLLFLFLYKKNNIQKKEKYLVPIDGRKNENPLIIHSFLNKLIKKNLKSRFLIYPILMISIQTVSYASFSASIVVSTGLMEKINDYSKDENKEMVKSSKIKNLKYLKLSNNGFLIEQLNKNIEVNSDLEIHLVKNLIEGEK